MDDLTLLPDRLEELVDTHESLGSPLRRALRPPLPIEQMVPSFPAADLELHPSVVSLFSWHDGLDWAGWPLPGYPALAPQCEFRPFSSQVEHQEIMVDAGTGLENDPVWRPSWFPILNLGRDAIAVECAPGPDSGALWYSSLDTFDSTRLFDSLDGFIVATIHAFQEGAFLFRNGYLRTSDEGDPIRWFVEFQRPGTPSG